MSVTLIQNAPQVNVGIQTYTFSIPATGLYKVHFEVTEVPPSGLSVLVKDNGSTVFTAPVIGQTQSAMKFDDVRAYTSGHTVTVVMAGSGNDLLINSVKSICSISNGET